ncbi:MAG: hypothetical protein H6R19_1058 [Proteobacteria bacterium]|nr:hypothetical protein [Pseudomonadota bacterium]
MQPLSLPALLSLVLVACATTPPTQPAAARPGNLHLDTVEVSVKRHPDSAPTRQATRVLPAALIAQQPADPVDVWGGTLTAPVQAATGFFQVRKLGKRWWLIDPAGQPFIHAAVADTRPAPSPAAKAAFAQQWPSTEDWATQTASWLRDQGFNGVGAWSDTGALGRASLRVPQTRIVNFMSDYAKSLGRTHVVPGHTGYLNDAIPVFDPGFAAFATQYAQRLVREADNPAIIGWFSDNEMPLEERTLENFLKLPESDPNGLAVRHWLAERQKRPVPERSAITQADRQAWVGYVYETYARIVSSAIREADPHHLYLGSRFHGGELRNPQVFAAAGKYLDVISINYYRTWTPDPTLMRNWAEWSGRPVLITEWYAKGEDSGLANTTGAGWVVPTQTARGQFYQHFALGLLESGVVVGWHWFKYLDNDPEDPNAEPSNRDANKGLLDIRYRPYAPLVGAARDFNLRKYALAHALDSTGDSATR